MERVHVEGELSRVGRYMAKLSGVGNVACSGRSPLAGQGTETPPLPRCRVEDLRRLVKLSS